MPRNPFPTVDVVIETDGGIVLIERAHEPRGWALPGGFVDYGERLEDAARREVREETGLEVELTSLLGAYSDPDRDPRQHNLSVVYVGRAEGTPVGGDDAARARVFHPDDLPSPLCFDHAQILADYRRFRLTGERPAPALPHPPLIGPDERAHLLAVARDALESAVLGRPPVEVPGEDGEALARPGACFVTLSRPDGSLRGCIGSLDARRPLAAECREMATAAGLRDPRFPPVEADELPDLRVSLSVISPMRPVRHPSDIRIGRDGVCVERGEARGVLLPQVAVEQRWDAATFLDHTCAKAGLPPEAWRDPETILKAFSAEVFGEGTGEPTSRGPAG